MTESVNTKTNISRCKMQILPTKGVFPVGLISIRRRKTLVPLCFPVAIVAIIIYSDSPRIKSLVPLQSPFRVSIFLRRIINAPTFSLNSCGGGPDTLSVLRNSAGKLAISSASSELIESILLNSINSPGMASMIELFISRQLSFLVQSIAEFDIFSTVSKFIFSGFPKQWLIRAFLSLIIMSDRISTTFSPKLGWSNN